MRIVVVINPRSGPARGQRIDRASLAQGVFRAAGIAADVHTTSAGGQAHNIATQAARDGVDTVVAWGGDGTVNEIARALVFTKTALAIVPGGSGNGLARELQIPFAPQLALTLAAQAPARAVDAGEIDGRLFFNAAGAGLDARVAAAALNVRVRRGLITYLTVGSRELLRLAPLTYSIVADGQSSTGSAALVVLANSRQYGYRAQIAPAARLDDGWLDLIVVDQRALLGNLRRLPSVFMGSFDRQPGVISMRVRHLKLSFGMPALMHVDGEPFECAREFDARIHPGALLVRAPLVRSPRA